MTSSKRTRNKSRAQSASGSGVLRAYAVVNHSAHRNDIGMAWTRVEVAMLGLEYERGLWVLLLSSQYRPASIGSGKNTKLVSNAHCVSLSKCCYRRFQKDNSCTPRTFSIGHVPSGHLVDNLLACCWLPLQRRRSGWRGTYAGRLWYYGLWGG